MFKKDSNQNNTLFFLLSAMRTRLRLSLPPQVLGVLRPPDELVLREGWEAVLPQALLGEVWRAVSRLLSAHDGTCDGE